MMWIVLAVIGLWIMAYNGMNTWIAWGALAAALLMISFSGVDSTVTSISWFMLIAGVTIVKVSSVRRCLVSGPVLRGMRKTMPPISDTERDALESGTVWWDAELFCGKPDWDKLQSLPSPKLSNEEQAFIDGPVEQLCEMLDDWDITHNRQDLPPEVWEFLKNNRFFGFA